MAVTWKKLAYAADVSAEIDADIATHAALTTTHGAVSTATASKIVVRDASARAKFAAPAASGDTLIKGTQLTLTEMPRSTANLLLKAKGVANPAYERAGKESLHWTANKLLKGAGAGADPTEIDVPVMTHILKSHTRDYGTASGSVSYTGYGFQPRALIVIAAHPSSALSVGLVDVNLANMRVSADGAGPTYSTSTAQLINQATGGSGQRATLSSLDADGFTLAWTKTGTWTGAITFIVLALR